VIQPEFGRVELAVASLATASWGEGPASILMLHDGLGSTAQWRGVPAMIAEQTGATVLAYDRSGHGSSEPVPRGPWPADWLHREAEVLASLIDHLALGDPLLVGHSDGGSIALIHAADRPHRQAGVVTLAAHSFVEPICGDLITAMRSDPDAIVAALGRHHHHAAALFKAWSGVWVSPRFGEWDIRSILDRVVVPVVVAQGTDDEYGTDAMAILTAESIGDNARCELVDGVGHLMHHDAPDVVVGLIADMHTTIRN